ncbi:hypothetical protein [Paenibacillus sp. HJGM_3]|uniref:hypothetical protein n=1 Tax=Paenibacillus sp. HJGM_3 TaxID=3379816 RepID=UPI00385AB658
MSFCCGASMIGTKGTLKHLTTHIHNVPLLFCPVCHRVDVHYLVEMEYEILAEYAVGDGAAEVDFDEYVEDRHGEALYENCVSSEREDPLDMVRNQIDSSLDLLMAAKALEDEEWIDQLKKRLSILSQRRDKLRARASSAGPK